jgi:hypothetical protein
LDDVAANTKIITRDVFKNKGLKAGWVIK